MTTNMDDKGAARTTAQDHLRSMLDLMRQGARINLSGIPDDSTFLSSNIPGEIAKEIAALIQPPTPASGEQMEVVAGRSSDEIVAFESAMTVLMDMSRKVDPQMRRRAVRAAVVALTVANERAERLERERDEARASAERQWAGWVKEEVRRNAAEALNTTLSEALQAAGDEISSAMMDDNKQRFHRLNKLRHTIRTALAALPAKQGGQSDEA